MSLPCLTLDDISQLHVALLKNLLCWLMQVVTLTFSRASLKLAVESCINAYGFVHVKAKWLKTLG